MISHPSEAGEPLTTISVTLFTVVDAAMVLLQVHQAVQLIWKSRNLSARSASKRAAVGAVIRLDIAAPPSLTPTAIRHVRPLEPHWRPREECVGASRASDYPEGPPDASPRPCQTGGMEINP